MSDRDINIARLRQVEDKLIIKLLSDVVEWNSEVIESGATIERLWTPIGNYELSLMFIHRSECWANLSTEFGCAHVLQGSCGVMIGEVELLSPVADLYLEIDGGTILRSEGTVCSALLLSQSNNERSESKRIGSARRAIIVEYFLGYYRNRYQGLRAIENNSIQRGDWIEIDPVLVSDYDKREIQRYIGMRGFVIKRTETLIDARFGNDRIQLRSAWVRKIEFADEKNQERSQVEPEIEDEDFDPDFL